MADTAVRRVKGVVRRERTCVVIDTETANKQEVLYG